MTMNDPKSDDDTRHAASLVVRRMHAQRLWGPGAESLADVVRAFGAMQAQEFAPAKWAIAQRMRNEIVDGTIQAAYDTGELLRTHVLRPTWHFVHPLDIRWLLCASAPRVHALSSHYYRREGVDAEVVTGARHVFEAALGDGRHLTRPELASALAAAGLPSEGLALTLTVMHAEVDGVLISGAMRGTRHTYTLLDLRVPPTEPIDRDEALGELCRRYFRGHGPATLRDLTTWASLTVAEARRGLDVVGGELDCEHVGGRTYYVVGTDKGPAPAAPWIDLLQDYDEAIVGYSESRDVMLRPDGPTTALVARWRAMLLDGRLIGFWRHRAIRGTGGVEVEIQPSRPLSTAEYAALDGAIARLGAFLQVPTRRRTEGIEAPS